MSQTIGAPALPTIERSSGMTASTSCRDTIASSAIYGSAKDGRWYRRGQRQNPESRAKIARCIRTLTFILSLTGRGDRKRSLEGLLNSCGGRGTFLLARWLSCHALV